MRIDNAAVMEEIYALQEVCESVSYDLNRGLIKLEQVKFPRGWRPRTGAILYDLPQTYRQKQPEAYIPMKMSYRGMKPMIMLTDNNPPSGFDNDAWAEHCIHEMHDWDPRRHTTITITQLIADSLKEPNKMDPY